MNNSDNPRTDGGGTADLETVEELFSQTSDVPDPSTGEKILDIVIYYIYSPLMLLLKDIRGIIGSVIVMSVVLTGTVGVVIFPQPTTMEAPVLLPPFAKPLKYPLGTGVLGQQIHRQIIHATPAMLKMILAGAVFSVFLGTFIGAVAGYKSGWIDYVFMIASDTMLTIPGIPLVIVIAAVYPPKSPYVVGIILGINNWPGLARTVRSQVLSLREEPVIEAARTMGLSDWFIVRRNLISNLMPYITINFANGARRIIFESVALYYLGVLPYTSSNWGVMMNEAYQNINLTNISELHWLVVPMMTIIVATLGFILLGQSLDRVFNVRLRAKYVTDDSVEETGDIQ